MVTPTTFLSGVAECSEADICEVAGVLSEVDEEGMVM